MGFCVYILKVKFKAISKTFILFLSAGQHYKKTHLLLITVAGPIPATTGRRKADGRARTRFQDAMKHADG